MFERFTRDARLVVARAEEEARTLGHAEVGGEHLLLALANPDVSSTAIVQALSSRGAMHRAIRDTLINLAGSPVRLLSDEDAAALASIGIDLDIVLNRVEESFGPGAFAPKPGRIRFSKAAKVVMALTMRESIRLKTGSITSEHLLLGLLRAKDGMAATILREIGVDVADLRGTLEATLSRAA